MSYRIRLHVPKRRTSSKAKLSAHTFARRDFFGTLCNFCQLKFRDILITRMLAFEKTSLYLPYNSTSVVLLISNLFIKNSNDNIFIECSFIHSCQAVLSTGMMVLETRSLYLSYNFYIISTAVTSIISPKPGMIAFNMNVHSFTGYINMITTYYW